MLHAINVSFKNEDKIKTFSWQIKVQDDIASRLVLQEMLKGDIQAERS